jgi:YD repeat-containing protein
MRENIIDKKIACFKWPAFLFGVLLLIFNNDALAQTGYNGGIEKTQVASLAGFTNSDTTAALQVNYVKDNNNEVSKKIKNVISLSMIEETPSFFTDTFSANVRIRISYGHTAFSSNTLDTSLTVTYNNIAGDKYTAKSYISFDNVEYVSVTILQINAPVIGSINTRRVLKLENEMQVTRYYQLATAVYPISLTAVAGPGTVPDELDVNWQWPDTAGNNYTQLEWTWLENGLQNNYLDVSNNFSTTLLFKNNATRVDLPLNKVGYNIPLFYDNSGKLYYRIRAVNLMASGTQEVGPWSVVDSFAFAGHNDSLNWQANTSYAEDGKRKTVIQYFDGSLRNRQTVTKDNTTNTTISAETLYDGQGRPAVQILPAPGINNIVAYTKNLNLFNGQTVNTDPTQYFDLTTNSSPNSFTAGLSTAGGASQYYSPLNTEINDSINKNIPDADSFPYVVTRYTPDATGRIMSQSGAGPALKMGSGHETKYFYGTPAQAELDGLFGTEVGNYTHYFENMVDDANGQMSISYVDMNGRTVATALAGDAPVSMDTLDIHNANDYPNQAGTQINRNLLDSGSNVFKSNGSIESVTSILAPATTTFNFNYQFPANTLLLPYCGGGTHTFNCIYDLQLSITDQSGNTAPIVWNYKNISSATVNDTITLAAGAYTVRKTLSIDDSTFQQYDSAYSVSGNGVCHSLQNVIDSVKVAMEVQGGCGGAPAAITCQSCLDSLGTYGKFDTAYAHNLGLASIISLTTAQQTNIRNLYVTDSLNCNKLSTTVSHTLDNIQQAMMADMIPYAGQYAKDIDSIPYPANTNSMLLSYNIFEPVNHYSSSSAIYLLPLTGGGFGNYYDQSGNVDQTIMPILHTVSKDTYKQLFQYSWLSSLLPYHPEYNQLVYAQTHLKPTYNWRDNFNQVTSYSQASTAGYITTSITSATADPFFTISTADKTTMDGYVGTGWRGGASLWKLAYSSAVCNSIPNSGTCTASNPPYSGLTTDQANQVWATFQSLYNNVRDSMVNAYIQKNSSNPDTANLVNSGFSLHFVANNSLLGKQVGSPNIMQVTTGVMPDETAFADTLTIIQQGGCLSYIPDWQNELLQCTALAGATTARQTGIINQITARMVAVCQQGTDEANPKGSSCIPTGATPTNVHGDTSFEEIVNAVYADSGISKDQYCNPYVIKYPKPYDKGPLLYHDQTSSVDSCNCKQYAQIVLNAAAAGYNPSVLSSLNTYLSSQYGDTLTTGMYAGLQNCSSLAIKKPDSTSMITLYVSKTFHATASVIVDSIENSARVDTTTDKITAAAVPGDVAELGAYYPGVKMTFLKFDSVATIPANFILLSATMNLYADSNGYKSPAYIDAHAPAVGGDTTYMNFFIPGFNWDKTTTALTFAGASSFYEPFGGSFQLSSPFQDQSIDMYTCVLLWKDTAITTNGLVMYLNYPEALGDTIRYATFCSNKYPDSSRWPTLNVTYTTMVEDSITVYDSVKIILPQPQPLPEFLKCGFNLNGTKCYTCSALSALTTQYKAVFTGTSLATAPDFTSSNLDTTAIAGNATFANYVNYKTGMQNTWLDYAQAVNATGCNLSTGSPSSTVVICPNTAALTDTAGLNLAVETPCQVIDGQATSAAQNIYQIKTQQLLASFDSAYTAQSKAVQEQFSVLYTPKEYHYTLYYYDDAGNLVKTVPPKGVHPDFTNSATVEAAKKAGTDVQMSHTYATDYRYNTLNQVVAQHTPDADTSHFWYDALGRLVVSQNSQQASTPLGDGGIKYSYTKYDSLGRIIEVGQKPQTTAMTQTISQDSAALRSWLTAGSPKEQITYTVYDIAYSPITGTLISQQNLRNRVSYTYTKNLETDALQYAATYYTYDVHGNVDTLLQDYQGLTAMSVTQNRFKLIAYNYDLISGKVNTVDYQPGQPDAFHHRYNYDAENRLTEVYTSRDSLVWERDASYVYYKHGPLARTILGQLQVQGIDYSYTLQGWLKGINQVFGGSKAIANGTGCTTGTGLDNLVVNYRASNLPVEYNARRSISFVEGFHSGDSTEHLYTNLDSSLSPCQLTSTSTQGSDIAFATEISPVANDAYGISLHYYPGDYKSIDGPATTGILGALSDAAPLYNGNIAAMAVNIPKLGNPLVYNYHYDQLNRITRMDAYNGLNPTAGVFTPVQISDYKERLTYDPNGNIMSYLRNGASSINLAMDSLHYQYNATTNQLNHVTDSVRSTNYTEDIDNQNTANYRYDAIGNLKRDSVGGVDSVYWTVYNKISRIKKTNGTVITYSYDPSGNRISKAVVPTSGTADTTCYVRDADGNVMSIYEKTDSLRLTETDIYGSSRVGLIKLNLNVQHSSAQTIALATGYGNGIFNNFVRGIKLFELSNHLGNVLATVDDKKLAVDSNSDALTDYYNADIVSAQDYSSFGATLVGRVDSSFKYRYGFNGQEHSDEINPNTTTAEFWEYDSRIGRRWNKDPLPNTAVSPYAVFNDNPICFSDALGDSSSPQHPVEMANVTVRGTRHSPVGPVPNPSKNNTSFDAGSLTMHFGGGDQTQDQALPATEVANNIINLSSRPATIMSPTGEKINTKSSTFELTEKLDHALTVFDMAQGMYSIVSNKGGNSNPFVGLPIVGSVLGVTGDEIDKGAQEFIDDALKNGYKGALAVFKSNVLAPQSGLTAVYVSQDVYNKTVQQGYLDMSVSYLHPTNETSEYPVDENGVKYSYLLIFKSLSGGTNGQPTKVTNLVAEKIN